MRDYPQASQNQTTPTRQRMLAEQEIGAEVLRESAGERQRRLIAGVFSLGRNLTTIAAFCRKPDKSLLPDAASDASAAFQRLHGPARLAGSATALDSRWVQSLTNWSACSTAPPKRASTRRSTAPSNRSACCGGRCCSPSSPNLSYLSRAEAGLLVHRIGFPEIRYYDRDGAQAYIFANEHDAVVTCRGTEPNDWNDVKADLDLAKAMAETAGWVHRGFKREVDELWPRLEQALVNNTRTLWFCGHSLGAAMAAICAGRCRLSYIRSNPRALYTYGSPRVGNQRYVNYVQMEAYRWVNNNDIVTRVPPAWLGYRHKGQEVYLNAYGKIRRLTHLAANQRSLARFRPGHARRPNSISSTTIRSANTSTHIRDAVEEEEGVTPSADHGQTLRQFAALRRGRLTARRYFARELLLLFRFGRIATCLAVAFGQIRNRVERQRLTRRFRQRSIARCGPLQQLILAAMRRAATRRRAGIGPVRPQHARANIVAQIRRNDFFDDPPPQILRLDREHHFHAAIEIPRHPVGAARETPAASFLRRRPRSGCARGTGRRC